MKEWFRCWRFYDYHFPSSARQFGVCFYWGPRMRIELGRRSWLFGRWPTLSIEQDLKQARSDCLSAGKATEIYARRLAKEQQVSDSLRKTIRQLRDVLQRGEQEERAIILGDRNE